MTNSSWKFNSCKKKTNRWNTKCSIFLRQWQKKITSNKANSSQTAKTTQNLWILPTTKWLWQVVNLSGNWSTSHQFNNSGNLTRIAVLGILMPVQAKDFVSIWTRVRNLLDFSYLSNLKPRRPSTPTSNFKYNLLCKTNLSALNLSIFLIHKNRNNRSNVFVDLSEDRFRIFSENTETLNKNMCRPV